VYTARPGSAAEAEERRRERFQEVAAPVGAMAAPEEESNQSFPLTLDLRLPVAQAKTTMEGSRAVR
jgi:uncharacterized protein (DUF2126 family)